MTTSAVDLSAHVAVVTGANHRIGSSTARALAAAGAAVLLTYLRTRSAVLGRRQRLGAPDRRVREAAHSAGGAVGTHRRPDLRRPRWISRWSVVLRREGRAGELHDVGSSRTGIRRNHGKCRLSGS